MHFLQYDSIYSVQETEVLVESLETIFDEAHFKANFYSFLQSLALPRQTFSQVSHLSPIPPMQNNFQISFSLDTSAAALVCIFSSILNHF